MTKPENFSIVAVRRQLKIWGRSIITYYWSGPQRTLGSFHKVRAVTVCAPIFGQNLFSDTLGLNSLYAAHSRHLQLKVLMIKGDLITFQMIPETFDLVRLPERLGATFEHPLNESGCFSAGHCDKIQSV